MIASSPGVEAIVDNGLLRVILNRPTRMNAVTTETLEVLADVFISHADDLSIGAAVLTGAGEAFCTGADLAGFPSIATIDAANRAVIAIRDFPGPVVAAINGPVAGVGVSLALACDITLATESSYFLLAFTKVGLMPDGGATALVAASVGRARALKMALLAERLPASEAVFAGLISDVYPDAEFLDEIDKVTQRLAAGPTHAYRCTKEAINDATLSELDSAFARERKGQSKLLTSTDFEEGVTAYLAKRPAVFGNRWRAESCR